ncbi:MAG: hypothetical protein K9J13_11080 [Saprospiraceae bacterium]|nr:hypothetical protein [Saprospiraceae bacterium]
MKTKRLITATLISLTLTFVIFLSSCYTDHIGYDGRPGNAFLSIDYSIIEPEYLDAGTSAIPSVFEWGRYYRAYPGYYSLYYEGYFWNGHFWEFYGWEIEYEIWENYGEPGGHNYNGRDGVDSYFDIICSPFGPYEYSNGRKADLIGKYKLLDSNEDANFTLFEEKEELSIKIKYKKVEKSKRKLM